MNPILNQILLDVLEIQEDKLAKAKDDYTNLKEATRVAYDYFLERKERVDAIKEALEAKE